MDVYHYQTQSIELAVSLYCMYINEYVSLTMGSNIVQSGRYVVVSFSFFIYYTVQDHGTGPVLIVMENAEQQ